MKKITSIAIALMMVLSATAMPKAGMKRAPQRTAEASIVNLDANFCSVEDVSGKKVEGVTMEPGCLKLSLINLQQDGTSISRFIAYIANDEGVNNKLNGLYSLGIGGMFVSYMVATETGATPIELVGGNIQVSYINTLQTGGTYDFYCYAWDENGNEYVFGMQLPTLAFKGEQTITLTDKAPLYEESVANFNKSYTAYAIDDQYFAEYGVLNLYAYDAESEVGLQFIVGKGAERGPVGIPVGTYTIDYSDGVGTVGASNGQMYGNVTESYAMLIDEEGYYTNVWYIKSGTVVVANNNGNLSVTLDGQNFLGKTVKATIGGGTGIESVKAAEVEGTAKTMDQNGQLMIIREGVRYNAQGAVIKR